MVSSEKKSIVGAIERIHVIECGMDYLARIDTGARTSSLHALDIVVENGGQDKQSDIGKIICFKTANEQGVEKALRMKISNVTQIANAQGIEHRYMVKLNLFWKNCRKEIEMNLRDRSHMKYKLLIGRDWLRGDYWVDVDKGEAQK